MIASTLSGHYDVIVRKVTRAFGELPVIEFEKDKGSQVSSEIYLYLVGQELLSICNILYILTTTRLA